MTRKVKEVDSLFDIESCQILIILIWKYAPIYAKGVTNLWLYLYLKLYCSIFLISDFLLREIISKPVLKEIYICQPVTYKIGGMLFYFYRAHSEGIQPDWYSSIHEILKTVSKKTCWTIKYLEFLRIDYASGKTNIWIKKRVLTSHRRNFGVSTKGWLAITRCIRLLL